MRGSSTDYAAASPPSSILSELGDEEAKRRRQCMLTLIFAVCFVDGADVQLLPASFRAMEANLGLSPEHLGKLALSQAITQAICAPIWGSLCDSGISAKWLLTAGVTSWGLLTMVLSTVSELWAMFLLRGLIGVSLACLLPVTQAVIAGLAGPTERGSFFGCAGAMQVSGQVMSQLVTTSISNMKFVVIPGQEGVWGWRVSFFGVGVLSLALGFVLSAYMEDLPKQRHAESRGVESISGFLGDMFTRSKVYLTNRTFCIIVLQGVFGSIPWSAMSFMAMYFQYLGFRDHTAAFLAMLMLVGCVFGNVIGGYVGDTLENLIKYHGRPLTGQITVFSGIPLVAIILAALPKNNEAFLQYAICLFLMGLLASWAMAGAKRPMLSQIIRSRDWASILALDTALEGASAALFGTPVVGYLAENVFGYQSSLGQVSEMSKELQKQNQQALATSMIWTTAIPWMVCFMGFSLLHATYPADAQAVEALQADAEAQGPSPREHEAEDIPLLKDDDGCMAPDLQA